MSFSQRKKRVIKFKKNNFWLLSVIIVVASFDLYKYLYIVD